MSGPSLQENCNSGNLQKFAAVDQGLRCCVLRTADVMTARHPSSPKGLPEIRQVGCPSRQRTHPNASIEAREAIWPGMVLVAFGFIGILTSAPLFVPLFAWFIRAVTP
jgi:hypothetical protein